MNNKLIFVTHNKGKVESANKYFEGQVEFQMYDYKEIRSENIEEIAIAKVLEAYEVTKLPTIAMEAGFYVEKLKGFPGVYVNHFLSTIGVEGLLKLMKGQVERTCYFKQCLAFYDGKAQPTIFYGEHKGTVSRESKGVLSKHDWSELSYIFIPEGKTQVLAEMTDEERVALTKENEKDSAFKRFKEWYIDYLKDEEELDSLQESMMLGLLRDDSDDIEESETRPDWDALCEELKQMRIKLAEANVISEKSSPLMGVSIPTRKNPTNKGE